jgi:hypothetical protein
MLWPWENSESHKQLSELIQILVSNFQSLWHGRPCRTLQDSDAIFWVEFFHSCQEAMFSMLPVCSVMITKQNNIKRRQIFSNNNLKSKFFLKSEDQKFVRNIPQNLH